VILTSLFKHSVLEPVDETIKVKTKLKKWAATNGYTLTFLSFMFIVTWTLEIMRLVTGQ
jgi:hypothetical protein